jgi:DNA repair exonuclease SbcCD nuclease subunit
MFRFIHAADIHLDSPLRGLERYEGAPADEIRTGSRRALERMVDLALARSVDFVVIAGDVYDGTWPDQNTGLFFIAQMDRLAERAIPVVVISGNHDAESKMTRNLKLPANVQRLAAEQAETASASRLRDLKVAVHGQSFRHPKVVDNLVLGYPQAIPHHYNLGVLHTSMMGYEQHDPYAPCTIADLKRLGYDYWALGHIHKREQLCLEPLVCFPGNIQGRSIRETGAKGCLVVEVDGAGASSTEFVPLDVMRWERCEVNIDEPGELDDWLHRFQERVQELQALHSGMPLALRVVFRGAGVAASRIGGDWSQVVSQVRAAGITATHGRCWIEKVLRENSGVGVAQRLSQIDWSEGPLAEVLRVVAAAESDETIVAEWLQSLQDLRKKLPDEVLRGEDRVPLDSPEWLLRLAENLPADLERRALGRGSA